MKEYVVAVGDKGVQAAVIQDVDIYAPGTVSGSLEDRFRHVFQRPLDFGVANQPLGSGQLWRQAEGQADQSSQCICQVLPQDLFSSSGKLHSVVGVGTGWHKTITGVIMTNKETDRENFNP